MLSLIRFPKVLPIRSMVGKPSPHLRTLHNSQVHNPNKIKIPRKPHDVFINHRGIDTKEKEAGLIYDYLRGRRFHPFLDVESLKPGEKFPGIIDEVIRECKLGISIFSPRYGESRFCLDELVKLMQAGKPLLPIFCDIELSDLRVAEYRVERDSAEEVKKYADALEEAKRLVGLKFKSSTGWGLKGTRHRRY